MKKIILFLFALLFINTSLFSQNDEWSWETVVDNGFLTDLDFVDYNVGWIAGHNFDNGNVVLSKTTDNGDSWIDQSGSIQGRLFGIHFTDSQSGFAAGYKINGFVPIILKTIDAGSNWQPLNSPLSKASFWDVFFTNNSKGFIVGNNSDNQKTCILGTTDGTTWNEIEHPEYNGILRKVFFSDENNGWIIGIDTYSFGPIILYTTNGGATWSNQTLPSSSCNLKDIFFINSETGWTVGEDNNSAAVYKTSNGGATWNKLNNLDGYSLASSVYMESEDIIHMLCKTSSPPSSLAKVNEINWFDILESADGGENWTKSGDTVPVEDSDQGTVAVSGGGTKTVVGGKYGKKNSNLGGVVTSVAPTPLAGTATPASFTGPVGFQIEVKAEPSTGWAFMHWTNAAPADQKTALATLASPPTEATAHFAPILTLSPGPSNPDYTTACPAEDETDSTKTPVIQIKLVASPADDWHLSGTGFVIEGNISANHVRRINLHLGDEEGPILSRTDFSSQFILSIPPPYDELTAGSGRTFMVTFDFEEKDAFDENNPVQFTVYTNRNFIGASAKQYPPGAILPTVPPTIAVQGGPIYIGCVHNIITKLIYSEIQTAIDANETLDDHTLKVCPGTYEENIKVTKSIKLESLKGKESTIIKARTESDHALHLSKKNTTIDGFTIEGASSDSAAGVYLKNGDYTDTKILNNKITNNINGIFLDYAQKAEMKGNVITKNKRDGIYADFSNGIKILDNSITENDSNGIFIKNHLIEESEISNNEIISNKFNGISLFKCKKILIKGNLKIEKNGTDYVNNNESGVLGSGIFGLYCEDSIKIEDNISIRGNNQGGIILKESKEFIIRNNSITNNGGGTENFQGGGVFLKGCEKFMIGGNRNKNEGNHISSNSLGVYLKDINSEECIIKGNLIGTNATGSGLEELHNLQAHGIYLEDASSIIIGGNEEGEENVISGHNNNGIYIIRGSNNKVIGNFIGTDIAGNDSLDNRNGIVLENTLSNEIGDATSENRNNIISGNLKNGIEILENSRFNKIWGNYIGTNKDGERKLPNTTGIYLDERCDSNYIGLYKGVGKGNVISGNVYNGVHIYHCEGIHIKGNKIGTNKLGSKKLQNSWNGIYFDIGFKCHIGGSQESERNIISGNGRNGLFFDRYSGSNKIKGNYIGTDFSGKIDIGNTLSGIKLKEADLNVIGGTTPNERNIISGHNERSSTAGIYISGFKYTSYRTYIWGNYIGTDVTGNSRLENSIGIQLWGSIFGTKIGGKETGKGNIISGNTTGISIKNYYGFRPIETEIIKNTIGAGKNLSINLGNDTGIYAEYFTQYDFVKGSRNQIHYGVLIKSNLFYYNKTHYMGINDKNLISNNKFKDGTGINTAISLDGSKSKIVGNIIQDDVGNAIVCKNGANPIISKNSLINNGYGLLNLNENGTINAAGNWWGDASGPGGEGPGSGDEVSAGVNFSGWAKEPIDLVAYTAMDTLFLPAGQTDSVFCGFQNWTNLNDVIDLEISDSLDWQIEPLFQTLPFTDSAGVNTMIYLSIQNGLEEGTKNKVIIRATSQGNQSISDSDSFYVLVYESVISGIAVLPDTVSLLPGDTFQFNIFGFDNYGRNVPVTVNWSATGGNIDVSGLYIAGETEGSYTVKAVDSASGFEDSSIVIINTITSILDENEEDNLPAEFALMQNFPNPFNPTTKIQYNIPLLKMSKDRAPHVTLKVYNILGKEVAILVNEIQNPGYYEVTWNSNRVSSGIYFYRIIAGKFIKTKKMILLR